MMQLKKMIAAVTMGFGFTAFAQANIYTIYDLGKLYPEQMLFKDLVSVEINNLPDKLFDGRFTFSVEPGTIDTYSIDLSFSFADVEITHLWVSVYTSDGNGGLGTLVFEQQGFLDAPDSNGKQWLQTSSTIDFTQFADNSDYVLRISGKTAYAGFGIYSVGLGGTAGVIPEPAEYAMLLAGLSVVGMAARRRKMKIN